MRKIIYRISLCGIAIALFYVLDLFSIKAGPFKISMSGLPIIIVGIMSGSLDAMIVGGIGAFLGQIIYYGITPTTLLWIIPHIARGLIIGLFLKNIDIKTHFVRFILVIVFSSIVVTIINTYAMWIDMLIYQSFTKEIIFGAFVYRLVAGIISAVIYSIITPFVVAPLQKYIYYI